MAQTWGGRFTGKTDPLMWQFNESLRYDRRLWRQDLTGSQAYACALEKKGILSATERQQIHDGLEQVRAEWANGTFAVKPADEDIHSANERRLSEIIGNGVAGKLHTGRSRNDQVATDMRLWLRDAGRDLIPLVRTFIQVTTERAASEIEHVMPGYTHLQRAQPIRWSHWLLQWAWTLKADLERLEQVIARCNRCPLGAGALAGNPFEVDREMLASMLHFDGVIENSLYATTDRDFVTEFMFWASNTLVHLSRWSEDLILYSTAEFGFVSMADAYSTGSSIMPQKKNADALELIRGKSGRLLGNLVGFMTTNKGLPSTYNKDLQEDKEPLFDSYDTVQAILQIATGVVSTLQIHPSKMRAALTTDLLATDLAEYLVRRGVPFRETHHVAGAAVKLAETRGISMADLSLADLQNLHSGFEADVMKVWDFEASVDRRNSTGGTSRHAIAALRAWLAKTERPQASS
ncbi:argininosuccinate lyase [Caulochytrium protostelioides]|uniref:Argininosuccinate lyase n=1 Tax=Caulochytrium protostelioides TaxID=1555241 RepID=A0A4P9WTY2_9FUNG|nr:argininosuccinate lyase [Caulochytrium protostelioides]